MKLLLIIGAAVATVGLFLLATASGDTAFFAQQYPLLLGLNAALAYVSEFVEQSKKSGTVSRAIETAKLRGVSVAP